METSQEKLDRMVDKTTFENIVTEMVDIYKKKNSDYGDSFTISCNEFGLTSPIIRLSDKLERFKTLAKQGSSARVENEKIEDTLLDLANYAVMTLVWMKNK